MLVLLSCPSPWPGAVAAEPPRALAHAWSSLTSEGLLRHIRVLASDEFEGRGPGTPGEDKSVEYITAQFKALGLKPGNPDGTYVQAVPLVGLTTQPTGSYRAGDQLTELTFPDDAVVWSKRFTPEVKVEDSEIVFVGYGVVAPEYGWDDYKGVDLHGKTLLMLINDPPVPDPTDAKELNPRMFKGKAMTYYGRWTYKYEMAAEKGAAAALIVHETGPAGYPWRVVVGSNARENFDLDTPDRYAGRASVEGWVTLERARKLCAATGFDFDSLKRAAVSKDFKPITLGSKASFALRMQMREVKSRNVIARLEGSDSKLRDQYVIYTAHWDHLGRDPHLEGDQIYHGAIDNASGTASVIELAQAFTRLSRPPKRSVLFLSVTAEEKGFLGSRYYASHPLYPIARTVAEMNIDGVNAWGRTRTVEIIGLGQSTLEEVATHVAEAQSRVVLGESEPEKGYYYRSDHFEFAKVGVPALYIQGGIDFIGKPKEFGLEKAREYTEQDYHKVTDTIKPGWDLSGAVEDLRLLLQTGWTVAEEKHWPEWKDGSEFKARRDAQL